jgi:glutaredoxin 3
VNEKVVVYRTRFCPYCELAARFLRDKGIAFTEIDVSGDNQKRRWLLEATTQRTVPQIFIQGQSIGGFVDLVDLDRRGQLLPMLSQAPPEKADASSR